MQPGGLFGDVLPQAFPQIRGDGHGLKRRAADAREHDVPFGDEASVAFFRHFGPERERLRAEAPDVGRDLYKVVEHQGLAKIEMDLHPRQPDVEPVEHLGVGQPHGPEQLRLRDLEEPEELSVIDDARAVDVGPANVLFDRESLVHSEPLAIRRPLDADENRNSILSHGRRVVILTLPHSERWSAPQWYA